MTEKSYNTEKVEKLYRTNHKKFMDFLAIFQGRELSCRQLQEAKYQSYSGTMYYVNKLIEMGLLKRIEYNVKNVVFAVVKESITFEEYVEILNVNFDELAKKADKKRKETVELKAEAKIKGARVFLMEDLIVQRKAQSKALRKEINQRRAKVYIGSSLGMV